MKTWPILLCLFSFPLFSQQPYRAQAGVYAAAGREKLFLGAHGEAELGRNSLNVSFGWATPNSRDVAANECSRTAPPRVVPGTQTDFLFIDDTKTEEHPAFQLRLCYAIFPGKEYKRTKGNKGFYVGALASGLRLRRVYDCTYSSSITGETAQRHVDDKFFIVAAGLNAGFRLLAREHLLFDIRIDAPFYYPVDGAACVYGSSFAGTRPELCVQTGWRF